MIKYIVVNTYENKPVFVEKELCNTLKKARTVMKNAIVREMAHHPQISANEKKEIENILTEQIETEKYSDVLRHISHGYINFNERTASIYFSLTDNTISDYTILEVEI